MEHQLRISLAIWAAAFLVMTAAAQEKLLRGQVLEAGTHRPLSGAHVDVQGGRGLAVCDTLGRFTLPWQGRNVLRLFITHVGHAPEQRTVRQGTDTELLVHLEPKPIEISEVTIRRPEPEVVYMPKDLHVGDHLINAEGLWVLVYERPQLWHSQDQAGEQLFREARLHLLDTLFRERLSQRLPERVRRLHCDHRGDVIVEGARKAWMARAVEGRILLYPIDRDTLHRGVLPWTDSIPGYLLGSNRVDIYPAYEHIAFLLSEQRQEVYCSVEDRHTMQLFRSQYKYMSGRNKVIAMDLELETGIDREVIAGHMTGFHRDPYFRMPYAPMFVVDGVPCVFDHAEARIRRFDPTLEEMDPVEMSHHRERGFREQLLQDPVSGSVHALFARHGRTWLREVDATTGQVGDPVQLTHPYPEGIQLHDGHAYYLYRPFGSTQHRTLYRERIR
jgi:hypothetical protein